MHPNEDELVLHYYGEEGAAPGTADHLASCPECRAAYQNLQRVLNVVETAPVPEPAGDYGARVWQQLSPELPASRRPVRLFGWSARRWAAAAAVAVLIVAAFLVGRFSPRPREVAEPATGRVLLVAVGDHLERSQMVLVELVNGGAEGLSGEQARAEDLIRENRLYRQTAAGAGETRLAAVLEELERVLLDIARSPDGISPEEVERLRGRVEAQGILFKVRVVEDDVRRRQAL